MSDRIAIMGGSAEAARLAQALGARTVWIGLTEPERVPARWPVELTQIPPSRRALQVALEAVQPTALVDASHPCDGRTPDIVSRVALGLDVPRVRLLRPAWRAVAQDTWLPLHDLRHLKHLVRPGARLLVTTGRLSLADLRALRDVTVFCRQLVRHDAPFPLRHGRYLFDRPPFSVTEEIRLLRRHRIDAVVTCNAGGVGGWPKLAAARALRLPVLLVARPRPPLGAVVSGVDQALRWLGPS